MEGISMFQIGFFSIRIQYQQRPFQIQVPQKIRTTEIIHLPMEISTMFLTVIFLSFWNLQKTLNEWFLDQTGLTDDNSPNLIRNNDAAGSNDANNNINNDIELIATNLPTTTVSNQSVRHVVDLRNEDTL